MGVVGPPGEDGRPGFNGADGDPGRNVHEDKRDHNKYSGTSVLLSGLSTLNVVSCLHTYLNTHAQHVCSRLIVLCVSGWSILRLGH